MKSVRASHEGLDWIQCASPCASYYNLFSNQFKRLTKSIKKNQHTENNAIVERCSQTVTMAIFITKGQRTSTTSSNMQSQVKLIVHHLLLNSLMFLKRHKCKLYNTYTR